MQTETLLRRLIELNARVSAALELGVKDRVLRSGLKVTISTPHVPGAPGPVQHYPKDITVHHRPTGAFLNYTKNSGREADIGMLRTPDRNFRTPKGAAAIGKLTKTVLPNLRKNDTAVSFLPLAQTASPKGVKTEKLRKSYDRILRRNGFRDASVMLPRYVPEGK